MDLDELRELIDEIDKELVPLLESRMNVSAMIAGYKRKNSLPISDPLREE